MKTRIETHGMNRHLPPALATPGDCTAVVNLRKRSGCLCPTGIPPAVYKPEGNGRHIICIHTCYDGEHYITEDNNGIYYEALAETGIGIIQSPKTLIFSNPSGIAILSTRTIGNTLIILCPQNIYYLLYKEGEYIFLGERPEIPILSFYPQGLYPISYPVAAHDFDKTYTNPTRIDIGDTYFYNAAYYSAFFKCQDMAWEEHRFVQPILVRYAITLYDGSRIYASAPVMISQTDEPLQPYRIKLPMRNSDTVCFGTISGKVVTHSYELMCKIHSINLNNWKDVIRSIDVFVAPEVTIFEPDLDATEHENYLSYTIEKKVNNLGTPEYTLIGEPYFNMNEIQERYLESSLFYKIASFDNWDEWEENDEILVECEVRPDQLVHEEILAVDNSTLLSTGAQISYIHNKRLHIANLTKRLFPGFPIGIYNVGIGDTHFAAEAYIRTYLKSERGESQVVWHGETDLFYGFLSPLISYPDSNAYKMEFVIHTDTDEFTATFNLTPSKYENRADYLDPSFLPIEILSDRIRDPLSVPAPQNDSYIQPNILRVSEYENPFIFPAEMTYTISNSAITGVASITSALSEGQFGEFSLYLFTEEGIWALQNGETSVCYETQHQLNRLSIPINCPIVPLENGILFITHKGIFAIQGSMTQMLLSFDEIVGESLTPITQQNTNSELAPILADTTKISEFVQGSDVAYNTIEEELIFNRPDLSYSLVIHLPSLHIYRSSQVYSHLYSDAAHLLGQSSSGTIYNLLKERPAGKAIAWVSRPITLSVECYQRWHEVCWRMATQSGILRLSLWGGNDAEGEFNLISRGEISGDIPGQALLRQATPPYKYFRLILTGEVSSDFHLYSVDVSAWVGIDNRLR